MLGNSSDQATELGRGCDGVQNLEGLQLAGEELLVRGLTDAGAN